MEATALFIRLMMSVMILLCAHPQNVDAAFLQVVPNRQQFFEYETVTFLCEGVFDYQVVQKPKRKIPCSPTTTGLSCIIRNVYPDDSGEYWCDGGGGRRSSVNITVIDGSVILESPALPVREGQAVTLRCRNKTVSSEVPADFLKDGLLIRNSSAGNIKMTNISKSDEGLYKCRISGTGESPESRFIVREGHKETLTAVSDSTWWIVLTFLLLILLSVMGLFHLVKANYHRVVLYLPTLTSGSGSAEDQTVSVGSSAADVNTVTYSVVAQTRKEKAEDNLLSRPIYHLLDLGNTEDPVHPSASSTGPSASPSPFLKEDPFYSTVQ